MARAKQTTLTAGTKREFRRATKRLRAAGRAIEQELGGHGLRMIGEEIMTDIKDAVPGKGVPVREGHLRGSGRVETVGALSGTRNHGDVELSFGGAAAPYAVIQHENLTFRHTVGEARYLVRGVERWSPNTSGAMREAVRSAQARLRHIAAGRED